MGAVLLVSSNSGIQLTDKGRELAAKLIPVDQMLYSMSTDLKAENREAEGIVRITATEAMTGLFIVPSHARFSRRYPRVLTRFSTPVNLLNFRDNLCDVMVGFGPLKDADIETRAAGFLHLIGIASKSYIDEFGVPTIDSLSKHRFIDADYYASQTPAYAAWREAVSVGTVAHHCNNPFNYALLVKAGLGIGLLGNFCLIDPDFVPVGMGIHVKLPIYIHALSERLRSKPVRVVFDWLADVFSSENLWFGSDLTLGGFPPQVSHSLQHLSSGSRVDPDR